MAVISVMRDVEDQSRGQYNGLERIRHRGLQLRGNIFSFFGWLDVGHRHYRELFTSSIFVANDSGSPPKALHVATTLMLKEALKCFTKIYLSLFSFFFLRG